MHRPSVALVAMLTVGCPEPDTPNLRSQTPEIAVAPDAIAFGERAVPMRHTETFFVSNGGRADLEVTVAVAGEGASAFGLPVVAATVEPDASQPFVLEFQPPTYLDYAVELVVTSNDEDTPELRIPVTGTGVAAPVPDIAVDRTAVDFGEEDDEATEIVTVTNAGSAPLSLGRIAQAGSGSFSLLTDPSGNTLAPGDDVGLVIRYAPPSTEGDSGSLLIPSDDPDEPEVEIVLLGNGGADYAYPEADIDCPPTVAPPRFVRLDGRDSDDPEGHLPLSYEWTLSEVPTDPGTSTPIGDSYLTTDVGDRTDLWVDAVGTYTVALVVENSLGVRSAPALCTFDATPEEDVLVQLTWNTTNADMDLHLAKDGAALFEEPGDACFCNDRPSWGAAGTADDASLNLDDRAGLGPEIIAVEDPANGSYDVRVHYFDDQGDTTVVATVRVYVAGALAPGFPRSQTLAYNEVWEVARINWPQQTVALLSSAPALSSRRDCFTPP